MYYLPLVSVVTHKYTCFLTIFTQIGDGVAVEPEKLALIRGLSTETKKPVARLRTPCVSSTPTKRLNKYNVELANSHAEA